MEITTIIVAIIGVIGIIVPAYWGHKEKLKNIGKDLQIKKLEQELKDANYTITESDLRYEIVDRLLDLTLLSEIKDAVEVIFNETKANRFLILIAMNGNIDFKMVSVIFEQHKGKSVVNAIARYRNLTLDDEYRTMLKKAEHDGVVELNVSEMNPKALLRSIYKLEGVTYSQIKFLLREPLGEGNDVVVFSSLATTDPEPFQPIEKVVSLTQYDSTIIPALKVMINPIETLK